MRLLKDDEILNVLNVNPSFVANMPAVADVYDKMAPVRPASLNLHVGGILIPQAKDDDIGGVAAPKTRHALKPGEIVVITSRETLEMPANIAGFGFPPPTVSSFGCIMTNAGHIDPGYKGVLRFTLINLGNTDFVLVAGDPIFVVMLVELSGNSTKDWLARRGNVGANPPSSRDMARLPVDFLDVDSRATNRATEISKQLIHDSELKIKGWGALFSILPVGLLTLTAFIIGLATKADVDKLQDKMTATNVAVEKIKMIDEVKALQASIKQLEQRFLDLERKPMPQPGAKPTP